MKRHITQPLWAVAVLSVAACGGGHGSDGTGVPTTPGSFHAVNAVDGSIPPHPFNVEIDNVAVDTDSLVFGGVSSITNNIPGGNYDVQIQSGAVPIAPSGISINTNIGDNNLTTVYITSPTKFSTQFAFATQESLDLPPSGQIAVQPVYAAALGDSSSVSVSFFSPPGNTSAAPLKTVTVAFGQSAPTVQLPVGVYEIVLKYIGASNSGEVFDSGPKGISLPATSGSSIVQIAAIDATQSQVSLYSSQLALLLIDSAGNAVTLLNGQN